MRDYRDAKTMAESLRRALDQTPHPVTHSESLELIAQAFGYADWNVLSAQIKAAPETAQPAAGAIELAGSIPIIRIFSVEKALEFYVGFLGFTVDWRSKRSDDSPDYIQVSRSGLVLHLSEHHGDGNPGVHVFIRVKGLQALHHELNDKDYAYMRPGIEDPDWGTPHRLMKVYDPFGNWLLFNEPAGDAS